MSRGPIGAANMPGAPSNDFWNQRMTPAALLGLNPGSSSKAAGAALPPNSVAGNDLAFVPWHPDSPIFWLGLFAVGTVLGITGASVRVRAFKRRAAVDVGNS